MAPYTSSQMIGNNMLDALMTHFRTRLASKAAPFALAVVAGCWTGVAFGDEVTLEIPPSTTRDVLQRWAALGGYSVMWSEGIPDFPTHRRTVSGDFPMLVRQLVSGAVYGRYNMFCPRSLSYPATAYIPDASVDMQRRMIFVVARPTQQRCVPR
ncbi:hypothetical protein [Paraburkholderia graminis]|uniref:Toxin co-regulated pilus biosynthesis protein Q C-terminal domain-containing protein n=1 Tax=Paraburkholderia graminis TaxID=60548 RepID=A0ABD5CSS5_9BURK|nr:hypothetical protein [Paraburkholderia graminis]MDR6208098.1 hypothetical protein [Paraburkholderia graminis]